MYLGVSWILQTFKSFQGEVESHKHPLYLHMYCVCVLENREVDGPSIPQAQLLFQGLEPLGAPLSL